MTCAVYPGTFDPITIGHLDIIERGATMFDELIVAVASNDRKHPRISHADRIDLIRESVSHLPNVTVEGLSKLLIDYLTERQISYVIRGLRAVSDFEYELQMALMNRQMYPELETIFLMPRQEYIFLSSSMVREIGYLGGDFSKFVPHSVYDRIREFLIKS
ncbi:pantetheine-phosphate adenylyltransferase [Chrysiogenes arsenatis]|uniref:pantetheine-phosphate adenylyltransferase n=1 Tax=Chrysiogenes arsenatis TaxID=309797 RepID=UPI000489449D|nr:pantetheine-phosphate adenylyltransferase [Chrysiogenes arsenatis]